MTEPRTDGGGDSDGTKGSERNVLGEPLRECSADPETGFLRDGHCRHLARDPGRHEVCAVVTDEFLRYSRDRGNDLVTPRPDLGFPGLSDGDRWCLCLPRWEEARAAGVAPPVVLAATNEAVLEEVPLETLRVHAVDAE
ncbi:DUF2237 family protein [Halobaculum sp. WSA2]|uniref:DUF2237 family protein n=1 Tax=Halobaculum saliterrae TaxID=2073113 RepID=A0A6B0SXH4_9EURY|nr:DUF2237 domain-containing protein [Halobaculum saliterrae]MXR43267.1 DUF2237 family protein [Halobaculum saliterrae]